MKFQISNVKVSINNIGFTLIEVILGMGIASIVGILLVVVIVNSAGLFTKESSKVTQGLNTNDVLSIIRMAIKGSSGISGQYIDGSTTYTTGATQLILKVPSIDSSNNLISGSTDNFVFYLDQNYLHLKTFPDPGSARSLKDKVVSTLVDSLSFEYLNSATPPQAVTPSEATKVKITLNLKQRNGIRSETTIATSEANLRND